MSLSLVARRYLAIPLSCLLSLSVCGAELEYEFVPDFIKPARGMETIGNGHGEIQVDSQGLIYVSVEGQKEGGLQVYNPDGTFLRQIPCVGTLHGFAIRTINGEEAIYATVLGEAKVLKMALDGTVLMEIPTSAFPGNKAKLVNVILKSGDRISGEVTAEEDASLTIKKSDDSSVTVDIKEIKQRRNGGLKLTNCDVAPNGDIYVVDGYGKSWVFVFDKAGKLINEFGGPVEPWKFSNAHKLFIDHRFDPVRILVCDRGNNRLLHLNLDGSIIGEIPATGLRRPSSVSFHGDLAVIAEIAGRISVIDKTGTVVAVLGVNDDSKKTNTNKVKPSDWKPGIVTSPHGVTFDAAGNILECEWNTSGRILRWNRK